MKNYNETTKKWKRLNKDKVKIHDRTYRMSEKGKIAKKKAKIKDMQKHNLHYKARKRTCYNIDRLNLSREGYCLMCGKLTNLQAHHIDYVNNVCILGVCGSCHSLIDRTRRVK